ncbi:MAG TPA: leucyl/phenylalanyl-tRNA--protein transferase [Tepidiformaceae bacterium]
MALIVEVQVARAIVPQALRPCRYRFPDPLYSDPSGLVATGGDFAPETIIEAYRRGIFPWPHPDGERLWFSPEPRAIIPVGALHVSRRLARTLQSGRFRVTMNAAFERVIRACADREEGTWVTSSIIDAYCQLHELGWAQSFEVWTSDGGLAGGLYGVRIGGLFGAESMFHTVTDASKVAMVALMEEAERTSIQLVDVQVANSHTASMGAVEIPRAEYLRRLAEAIAQPASVVSRS